MQQKVPGNHHLILITLLIAAYHYPWPVQPSYFQHLVQGCKDEWVSVTTNSLLPFPREVATSDACDVKEGTSSLEGKKTSSIHYNCTLSAHVHFERISEDHPVSDFQGLPVFVRNKHGLTQERVHCPVQQKRRK